MGQHDVNTKQDDAAMRRFTRQIIQDVRALEHMLETGMFETGIRRIGAEQELFLVDKRWQPAPLAEEVLALNTDERLVNELTRFNLEFNLTPYVFTGNCLSQMEVQIHELMDYTRNLAHQVGTEVVMCGILPTIHLSDLGLENMAPKPRYFALNDAIMGQRSGPAQYQIRGVDELFFQHDNILVEGCNTSFQTHFQVSPEEFPKFYNLAQVIAAPCLAAAVNSPILFGKRLWHETRIALFQQAVDTRSSNLYLRDMSPRVHFGTEWVKRSVTEIYKEDISRFRALLTSDFDDPFEELAAGRIPKLKALQLHNGTVYRWNRACYGITDGKPHLRIENRILPSGPTVIDEMANTAFWFGLITGLASLHEDVTKLIDFDDAKSNFIASARLGLGSQLLWLDGKHIPAHELITDQLLPIAADGLREMGIDQVDSDRYLGVLRDRCQAQQTGALWQLGSVTQMKKVESTRAERLEALVAGMHEKQMAGDPVHTWAFTTLQDRPDTRKLVGSRVEHFMSTDLFTVQEGELVEFVACLMDWRHIRHVIVEDHEHRLVGLVTHRSLLRYLAQRNASSPPDVPVSSIMISDPITVTPATTTIEAIKMMRSNQVGALPVVQDGHLVGIVTERDFTRIAGKLLDDTLDALIAEEGN